MLYNERKCDEGSLKSEIERKSGKGDHAEKNEERKKQHHHDFLVRFVLFVLILLF